MSAMLDEEFGNRDAVVREEWLQFMLEEQSYGINVLNIQEILYGGLIEPVPGAPPHVLGVINLRGSIVTIVDTHMRLGLRSRSPRESDWIIVLDVMDETVGLLVDEVLEVQPINPGEIETMVADLSGREPHVAGVIEKPGVGMLILLEAASVSGLRREVPG